MTLRDTWQKKEYWEQIKDFEWRAGNFFMSGFFLLLSLYGLSLYHNWIVRDRKMRDILDKTRSVEEEKKSKQNQQEKKKESLHDKRRKKSMQIKKRKKFKQNKKKKKVIEAQSTSLVWRAD